MLDPFQIRDKVRQIREARRRSPLHDSLAAAASRAAVFMLYRAVLQEIARGSIDAKSLAVAALEAEKGE